MLGKVKEILGLSESNETKASSWYEIVFKSLINEHPHMAEAQVYWFAKSKHEEVNQKRKYTHEDYIVHPKEVVKILRSINASPSLICAGWLHDTVEDTNTTLEEIEFYFGKEITSLVEMVTDVSQPGPNRKERKRIDREHIEKASPEGKTLKLADLISNTSTIVEYDPGFAKVYMEEKKLLLEVLKGGNPILLDQAHEIVNNYYGDK